jgi:hypothetical protein
MVLKITTKTLINQQEILPVRLSEIFLLFIIFLPSLFILAGPITFLLLVHLKIKFEEKYII